MSEDKRPVLGISVGDPGGIGPEIAIKALGQEHIYEIARPVVVCDFRVMEDVMKFVDVNLVLHRIDDVSQARFETGTLDILDLKNMPPEHLRYKTVTPEQGRASFEYVAKVIELALKNEIDGTVTGPINKAAIHAAGYNYAGHTEIYAEMTGTRDYAMMLTHGDFRVTHVSTHVSLRQACDLVKKDRIVRVIDQILPAVEYAVGQGKNVEGPIPADTVFSKMRGGMYDAVVVMYHDQGHIPMKLLGFEYDQKTGLWGGMSGVNVTLGLPIVRTSVDHGTAFGKAGEGRANPQSMIEAVGLATLLSKKS
jgi:4-hydroxy-L-threonine phosphate dehydrogenase PdxA